jgi:hypothetical protein
MTKGNAMDSERPFLLDINYDLLKSQKDQLVALIRDDADTDLWEVVSLLDALTDQMEEQEK